MKIDVKSLFDNYKNVDINERYLKLENWVKCFNGNKPLPFILALKEGDDASKKYVDMKMRDMSEMNIFNAHCVEYNDISEVREKIVDLMKDEYGFYEYEDGEYDDIPAISQIPSNASFDVKNIVSRVFRNMNIHSYSEDFTNINRAGSYVTDIDYIHDFGMSTSKHDVDINPYKLTDCIDVAYSSHLPATVKAVLGSILLFRSENNHLNLKRNSKTFAGLKIALVGCNSLTAGLQLSMVLRNLKATVSLYHSGSVIEKDEFLNYDIVISCVGRANLITKEHIGTSEYDRLCIDVGVSFVDGKVNGDFSKDIREDEKIHWTPYVNGIGYGTRHMLLNNLVNHYYYEILQGR